MLIDTGSTHNILRPRIASHLQIPSTPIPTFSVMVGNGSHIRSVLCPNVPITLQNNLFHIPFYLLPIEGADVVLGIGSANLGPSLPISPFPQFHFSTTATILPSPVTLTQHASFHQICHLLHTDSVASLHLLSVTDPTNKQNNPTHKPLTTTHTTPRNK